MNRTRLEMMADLLDNLKVRPGGFDMNVWTEFGRVPNNSLTRAFARMRGYLHPCGTSACAVGHAMVHPKFNAEGLRIAVGIGIDGSRGLVPTYAGFHNWNAVETFFDLSGGSAGYLFNPTEYPLSEQSNPGYVALRVRCLLDAYGDLEKAKELEKERRGPGV
jgi:hypothetical protein